MRHDTLMWEVPADEGRMDDLLDWIERTVLPELRSDPRLRTADVYTSGTDRAVVIAHCDGDPPEIPEPPAGLVRREPDQWPFRHVRTA